MQAIEFLKNKGITKATCYTNSSKTYYVNELAELMEEYAALRQPLVISSFCKCKGGAVGRTVTADFEHQICDKCGNIAK
jgi:hypothetical protein